MKPQRITSPIVQAVLVLLCVMWSMAGWAIFLAGSFTTSPRRRGPSTTVEGMGAEFIGVVFIVLGLLGIVLLVQSLALGKPLKVLLALVLAVVPPLVVRAWLTVV